MERSRASMSGRWLLGVAGGAAAAYFLDPADGARRRAVTRDVLRSRVRRLGEFTGKAAADLEHRAAGAASRMRTAFRGERAPDAILEQRVRARLGREVSHPRSIEVEVCEGDVVLRGPILSHEVKRVLRAVGSVRGVRGVLDQLEHHDTPEGVPALQGGAERRSRPELLQASWAPATRLGAGALGGALVLAGAGAALRGPAGGIAALPLGAALLLRAIANRPLHRTLAWSGAGSTAQHRKTLEAGAREPQAASPGGDAEAQDETATLDETSGEKMPASRH